MIPTLTISMHPGDLAKVKAYFVEMGRRAAREQLVPIMLDAFQPVVAAEKAHLSGHSKTGALEGALRARAGSGDRKDTISVFSAPTAKKSQIAAAWATGNLQKRRWAQSERARKGHRGRRKIFYADYVERGHRVVRRSASGELKVVPNSKGGVSWVEGVHFAEGAMDSAGDAAAAVAEEAILDHILG